ncbi:MAG TPA: DapH/DapD/GlmU-related protein [Solirubrobacteraceae bacterium]|nr:DapH/DapD/GlmU-related protein [Solirubrobacteraceae bacterium]
MVRRQIVPDGGWTQAGGAFVAQGAQLGDGVVLAPGAVVHTGARLGAGCSVGSGAVIHEGAELGGGCSVGSGAVIHQGARLGGGCSVGSGAVIHQETALGEDCLVEDGALLGKRPRLRPGSSAAGELGPLSVADGVTICAGAIVYAAATIGPRAIIGDQAHIRERALVGERTVVGRGSTVDFDARLGARVLIQTLVYVTAATVVEDDVFIGPGVVMTNDNAMGRHPAGEPLRGPVLRRACRVGGGVVLAPGVDVGEEAFIAAGAVVVRDVAAREVVMGVPARAVRTVPDADLLERWPQ